MTQTIYTTPAGKIMFAALNRKIDEQTSAGVKSVHKLKLEINGNTSEGKALRSTLDSINKNLAQDTSDGNFTIQARTQREVNVFTSDGVLMSKDEVPAIQPGGTAVMHFTSFTGKSGKGGGINLTAVTLLEYEEFVGSGGGPDMETITAAVRKSLKK